MSEILLNNFHKVYHTSVYLTLTKTAKLDNQDEFHQLHVADGKGKQLLVSLLE